MDLTGIDRRLSEIAGEIDLYAHLTPLNSAEEMKAFFDAVSSGAAYDPVYCYRRARTDEAERVIGRIKADLAGAEGVGYLLLRKAEQIERGICLLRAGDDRFAEEAVRLHGIPDEETVAEAYRILEESLGEENVFPEETVSPRQMAREIEEALAGAGIEWRVSISRSIIPKITVSGSRRTVYINSRIYYTPQEVRRLKVHEVEVHIYRGGNGSLQPYRLFAEGTAGYNATEEGLAIAAEEITGCLEHDRRQMKLYAGRAVAAALSGDSSFYEVFTELARFFPDRIAYRLVERVKRGMRDTSGPGGLTKGYHYIRGWLDVKRFIAGGGDWNVLYSGKIGVGDAGTVKELMDRGELNRPAYLPGFARKRREDDQPAPPVRGREDTD
jgi:uncharacterized protein (TIGR02421 family)